MFTDYMNRILGTERGLGSNRQETITTPDVIKESSNNPKIPKKYREDIESLQEHYGESFKTGLCIKINLQALLRLCPRERCRIDAYRGLVSYLEKSWGIVLKIISQKTKEDKKLC